MQRSPPLRAAGRWLGWLGVAMLAVGAVVASAAELTVSAATSLTNAFGDLGPIFEAAHPGTRVLFNFGASGALLQQIASGAPVDVFVSADEATMDQAEARRLVLPAQRRDIVGNSLVVVVPVGASDPPRAIEDLAQRRYQRIAIGLPASVPVGRYTKDVLETAGLWRAIEPKAVGANNVRQALDYVARAEVDAGFVYATDAALMPGKVQVALTVPTRAPIRYPAAPVAASDKASLATTFIDFVLSPRAQAVLARHGFARP